MSTSLSLYDIEQGILDLVEAREGATDPELIANLDKEIALWIAREIQKVDGIRSFIRAGEAAIAAAKEEAARQQERARVWQGRIDRLKDLCLRVMQDSGLRKLEGRSGVLAIHGNGGVEPLQIGDPMLLPDDVCKFNLSLTCATWLKILSRADGALRLDLQETVQRVPDQALIRDTIATEGGVIGALLLPRGEHLRVK